MTSSRTLVFGNSGSGKSHLAAVLSRIQRTPSYDLDLVYWRDQRYQRAHSDRRIQLEMNRIIKFDKWIIEGVYTHLLTRASSSAKRLIWLDLPIEECVSNFQASTRSVNDALKRRQEEYYTRTTGSCRKTHFDLYHSFLGRKICLTSRCAVEEFIKMENN